jgi:putative redox protein
MSLTATAHSVPGTLQQQIVIDGTHHLITDEPVAVGGDGSAPAPHELLPAALASCISTVLVMYGRTKEWDLGDVSVDVEYDNHATPRRFEVGVSFTGDLSEEQLARLTKVAETCPVRRSLEAGMVFVEELGLRAAGGTLAAH